MDVVVLKECGWIRENIFYIVGPYFCHARNNTQVDERLTARAQRRTVRPQRHRTWMNCHMALHVCVECATSINYLTLSRPLIEDEMPIACIVQMTGAITLPTRSTFINIIHNFQHNFIILPCFIYSMFCPDLYGYLQR